MRMFPALSSYPFSRFWPERPRERLLIADVDLLDPRDASLRRRVDLLVDEGKIIDIAPAGELPAHGATLLAGAGRTALPGLIDAHLHALGTYAVAQPGLADLLEVPDQILRNLRALIRSGVTTVRDLGSPLRLVTLLRDLAKAGRIDSPRLLTSGPILSVPGGYPLFLTPLSAPLAFALGQLRYDLRTTEQARRTVDLLVERHVDVVKAMYTGADYDDARTPMPRLPDELLRAIVDRAHHHGLPVAVHQVWRADLDSLLDLPFDTLEHLPIDAPMTARDVARIVERRLPVTTTLMTYGIRDFAAQLRAMVEENRGGRWAPRARRGLLGPVRELAAGTFEVPFIGRRVIETGMTHQLASLALLREAGARVMVGTDQGGAVTPCGCIAWELGSMTRAGYTAAEALRMATSVPAVALGLPELGHLAPGYPADLILTRGNPAEDLTALDRVELVLRDGRIFHRAEPGLPC